MLLATSSSFGMRSRPKLRDLAERVGILSSPGPLVNANCWRLRLCVELPN